MFTQSTAARVLLKSRSPLVNQPRRHFQQYGSGGYRTGFERMLNDKAQWVGISGLGGIGFIAWGLANIGTYGLSLVMDK